MACSTRIPRRGPPVTNLTFTGTYSITADGLGTMTFNPSQGPPLNFAIAVYSSGGGRLIQSDPANPQAYGSGAIKAQTIVALSGGNFAFGAKRSRRWRGSVRQRRRFPNSVSRAI